MGCWRRCSLGSASLPAKVGRTAIGPNPPDHGEPGSRRHRVAGRRGITHAVLPTGANLHDGTGPGGGVLEEALKAVAPARQPRGRPG